MAATGPGARDRRGGTVTGIEGRDPDSGAPGSPGRPWLSASLPGSPLAELQDRVRAELAVDSIPVACPHPATADNLNVSERILACNDCIRPLVDAADAAKPPQCACCGARATRTSTWAADHVYVVARLCDVCGTAGNVPLNPN